MARTQNLSDASALPAKVVARKSLFSDIGLDFKPHPNTGDITTLRDLDAIKQSVKNLILTSPGERPFNPYLGSTVRSLLFEPADAFTAISLKRAIELTLLNYEPRIQVSDVEVEAQPDQYSYKISISYQVITTLDTGDVTFYLERIR